eukprot:g875.t1
MDLRYLTPLCFSIVIFVSFILKKQRTLLHERGKRRKFWKDWQLFRECYYDITNSECKSTVLESEQHFYTLLSTLQQIVEYGPASSSNSVHHLSPMLESLESKLHKTQMDRESYIKEAISYLKGQQLVNEFDEYPMASGLIAQIHCARLISGIEVAVKLRHENIKSKLGLQYKELTDFACFLTEQLYYFRHGMELGSSAFGVLEKLNLLLEEEIDLLNEAENYCLMQKLLSKYQSSESSLINLRIPNVISELSRENLLVTERVNGVPFLDARYINEELKLELLRSLLRFYGFLILQEGCFPCDPHTANLLISRSAHTDRPQLVLIDFGQVTRIDLNVRVKLAHIILALAADDEDRITKALNEALVKGNMIPRRYAKHCASQLFDTATSCTPRDISKDVTSQKFVYSVIIKAKNLCRGLDRIQLPLDFYFVIRVIGILRNLLNAFTLKVAISEVWEDIASKVIEQELRDNGTIPSLTSTEDDGSSTTTDLETHSLLIQSEMNSDFSFPQM